MPNRIPLSALDNWAIRTEVGERLRTILPVGLFEATGPD
jgi:hypothetical protein